MSDPENHFTNPAVTEGYGHSFTYYRWKPYKPQHRKQSKKLGRWQCLNEYGGFDNCDTPGDLFPKPVPVVELIEENKRLKTAIDHWRHEVGKLHSQIDRLKHEAGKNA